ncbi:MAG: right-handed parallel beta-helix repeat-containing protein, partial [Actinobacteria bacterium]|nr:right-handed parallel beta-helix repeat-containing protein [Actinomycetota bacterium]
MTAFPRWLPGVVLIGSLTSTVEAQTDHSGDCSGTFTAAGNPHRLVGHCIVPAGGSLTLQSGVVLEGGVYSLLIDGQLNANGVTFNNASLNYRAGSSGTLENSTLSGNLTISTGGTTEVNAAAPVIRGNTINAAALGINVTGTSRPAITGNTITTDGTGIRYNGTAGGTASGNVIRFSPEGRNSRVGVEIMDAASPVVDDNTVEDDPRRADYGIAVDIDVESTTRVTNNRLRATADDVPLRLASGIFALASTAVVSGNVFPLGEGAGIGLYGAVVVDSRYEAVNGTSSFLLTGAISVSAEATLTIATGVTLDGVRNTLSIDGELQADGVTFNDVYLTYRAGAGGTIENCTLRGQTPVAAGGNSVVNPAVPVIRENRIISSGVGIEVSLTARPTIT